MSEVFDIDCPECGIKCWFNNGDSNDLSVMDVEAVQCWHCHSQFKVNEDDEENISEKLIRDTFQTASQAIDEQTQPGLLPCPFCGDESVEVVCPWNSDEVAITCPSNNCLVFGRQGIGDRKLTYGPRWAARNWWNTRANKTQ